MPDIKPNQESSETEVLEIISLTPENILKYGFCGYKDATKHTEMMRKADWYKKYYPKGLRIKVLMSQTNGSQGMIEYIPGEYAHRPVSAGKFMFIHCLFVGYKKEYKQHGHGSRLIQHCLEEARELDMDGAAVIARKGSFMARKDIYVKNGFNVFDQKKPDFELLGVQFKSTQSQPVFNVVLSKEYLNGLYILRSPQCPYTEKNVLAMVETAKAMGLSPKVIELSGHEMSQNNPSPFGTFALVYNGEVLSHHPISNTRFQNIMRNIS